MCPTVRQSSAEPASAVTRWVLLATVGMGVFLITLDNTILYTALPRLVEDLNASITQQLWIVNAYPVVIAGLLLGTGTLGDKIGHATMFIIGMSIFGVASLLAAFAVSPEMLIAARALLAVGAATMMPSTLSLIRLTFTDPQEMNFAIGIWASLATISSALGPIVGGALLEVFWWGSAFLLNIPFVVLALVTIPFVKPAQRRDPTKHWDWISSAFAMVTLVSVVLIIKEAAHSPQNWALIAVAVVLALVFGTLFVRRQDSLAQPLITLDIFRSPSFRSGAIGASLAMFAIVGLQYITTQKLQLADGFSPLQSGLVVAVIAAGSLVTSLAAGASLRRMGVRRLIAGGLGVSAIGTAIVGVAGLVSSTPLLVLGMLVLGMGMGGVMSVASIAMISGAPPHRAGMASSVEEVSYEFGSLTAVAILGSLVTFCYSRFFHAPAGSPPRAGESLQDAVIAVDGARPIVASSILDAAASAYSSAYAVTAGVVVVTLIAGALYTGRILRGVRVELQD